MRPRPSAAEQEAVHRRLELLRAELIGVPVATEPGDTGPTAGAAPIDDDWLPVGHTRVRRDPADEYDGDRAVSPAVSPAPSPVGSPAAPALPMPGRHAARRPHSWRSRGAVTGLVPATLRGRVTLGPSGLALIAVAVALGLAVTAWWVVRGEAERQPLAAATGPAAGLVTLPSTPSGAAAEGSPADPAGQGAAGQGVTGQGVTGEAETGEVVVDVAGKVRRPGIAVLPGGSRVADALEAAGGVRRGVDLATLNLARVLVDGEQILVGVEPPPGVAAAPGGATTGQPAPGATGGLVSLNSADQAMLETLPGVGPVTAAAILEWRGRNGAFSSVEELIEVSGIGPATLAKLLPHVTL